MINNRLRICCAAIGYVCLSLSSLAADKLDYNPDPRAEIFFKSAIDLVVFSEAVNLALEDPELRQGWLSRQDVTKLIDSEIAPTIFDMEKNHPSLLSDPAIKLIVLLKGLPYLTQADGKTMAKGIYDAEKSKKISRYGREGCGAALTGRFLTALQQRRAVLKAIAESFQRNTVAIRGDEFCNSVIVIATFASMSNYGAESSGENKILFNSYDMPEIVKVRIERPLRALEKSSKGGPAERVKNNRAINGILEEIESLNKGKGRVMELFVSEKRKAMEMFDGSEFHADSYLAEVIDTVIEIQSERVSWVIKYPVFSKNGLDWSDLQSR